MRRLFLVRHAPTAATRAFAFPADEAVDERGLTAAAALRDAIPSRAEILCSPLLRCQQTVRAAGLGDPVVEPLLAECDFGSWAGHTLEELSARDEDAVRTWMADPDAAPHGGESLTVFATRVAAWLDGQATGDGVTAAVTHGGVVKAAIVHALQAPVAAFWRVDASPLAVTELHAHDGRWTVSRVNCPVGA